LTSPSTGELRAVRRLGVRRAKVPPKGRKYVRRNPRGIPEMWCTACREWILAPVGSTHITPNHGWWILEEIA
jgi:hypothetical protein